MFKRFILLSLVMILMIPACVLAFPINGLMVANSMTFTTFTINIVGVNGANSYSPDTVTLTNSNDSVIWDNIDANTHTATCGSGSPCGLFDTGNLNGPNAYSARLGVSSFALGTTGYYCNIHGYPAMYGAIIKTLSSVPNWEKMSPEKKEKALEEQPVKNAFGMTFVSPNDSPSTKVVITNVAQQTKDDSK